MDLQQVSQALQRASTASSAVDALLNYNSPLSEKELTQLTAFRKLRLEQIEGGLKVEEIPEDMMALAHRPVHAFHPLHVVQCVVSGAKLSCVPRREQTRLLRRVLPFVAATTPLSLSEWCTALGMVTKACLSSPSSSPIMLRCVEEVLRLAAPVVFSTPALVSQRSSAPWKSAHAPAQPRKDTSAPKLKEFTAEEAQQLLLKTVATLVEHYASQHGRHGKHGIEEIKGEEAVGREVFLHAGPIRRLQRLLTRSASHSAEAVVALVAQRLSPVEAAALVPVLRGPLAVQLTKDQMNAVVKAKPGLLFQVLGGNRIVAGTLNLANADTVLQFALYTMGITSTGPDAFLDYLGVVAAAPAEVVATYMKEKGKDAAVQLFVPFCNSYDAIKAMESTIRPVYKNLWRRWYTAVAEVNSVLLSALAAMVGTRCRTPREKALVMEVFAEMIAALPTEVVAAMEKKDLITIVNREASMPAADSAEMAFRLAAVLGMEASVADGLLAAVKNSKKEAPMRRALLVQLSLANTPAPVVESLVTDLLRECVDVVVARPDAYLGLGFALRHASLAPKVAELVPLLTAAGVLSQLQQTPYEEARAAEVALALAKAGHLEAMAQLLTHRSGTTRYAISVGLADMTAEDTEFAKKAWASLTRSVVGLESVTKLPVVGGSTVVAVVRIAEKILPAVPSMPTAEGVKLLAELLLALGHDHVQGADDTFFLSQSCSIRRVRGTDEAAVDVRPLKKLAEKVGAAEPFFTQYSKEILEILLSKMATAPEHVVTAACRALTLLTSQQHVVVSVTNTGLNTEGGVTSTSEAIFERVKVAVEASGKYFSELSLEDAAIAAEEVNVMDAYETHCMKEQLLLKTYPDRPPKGTSEEDFAATKKKDALALQKGVETLRAAVEKQAAAVLPVVHHHKAIFVALQLMGRTGAFNLVAVPILFAPLQKMVSAYPANLTHVLPTLAAETMAAMLFQTPLRFLAAHIARTVARLLGEKQLTVGDVSQISTMVSNLRRSLTRMLPAPLFVCLVPFSRVAFKAGRGANAVSTTIPIATQHQLLGMLMQNIGQADLPDPTGAVELLIAILQSFPSLYKSLQQGFQTLVAMVPQERLASIEVGLFNNVDTVREAMAASFHKFSHFADCRRAVVEAAVLQYDVSGNVAKAMKTILETRGATDETAEAATLTPEDWKDLLYILRVYGPSSVANTKLVARSMTGLFSFNGVSEETQQAWVEDLKTVVGGMPSVVTLQALSALMKGSVPSTALSYLCDLLESPQTTEVLLGHILSAGRVLMEDIDLALLKTISAHLRSRLSKPPKDITPAHREQYLATATVWLTIMSCRLQETALLESIIDQQLRTLNTSQSAMVHQCVCESMVEISRNESIRASPKLDEFVEKCMKQVITSGSYIKKKAHAWGVVGVLKGLGLPALRRYGVMSTLEKAAQERQTEKSGVMVLLEVLCSELSTKFEPYALSMAPVLLDGVADQDSKVSECADDAARELMKRLSSVGLRQLIPRLVQGLSSDVAKRRVPPLNFIGYVAFCSPKQLAAALPEIMKYINACLFDVNNAVSVAAFNALRRVAGVVSNPEIQEHVELVLSAMRSPSTDTENALDALLYTRFINVVDPASLALIIPVICRGLSPQMPHTRPKAAQIVASMVNLVSDPLTLQPYTEELVQLLEGASQDPLSESRTTAAKALAALGAAIGGPLIDNIVQWSFGVLQKITSGTIEKAGAAQAFVDLVAVCGGDLLRVYFPAIQSGMTDDKPPVREGFLYIMVFAPSSLPVEIFQEFLPLALPWVLEGLSHFSDKVRDVALAAGDSIVSLHGTRNLDLVLGPLLDGVTSEVSTLRHSSLLLSAKLMLHLVAHIKKKMRVQRALEEADEADRAELRATIEEAEGVEVVDEINAGGGEEEETGMLTMETARDVEKRGVSILSSLEDMLGTENMVRMLSALFCGRNEHNATVRTDTNMAWQACVASIRAAVNKIFDGLAQLLVRFASSDNGDCVEVAEKTIEFTTRINETIEHFVDVFCDMYKSENQRMKLGAVLCLGMVVQFADSKKLMSMGGQIIGCVLPGMQKDGPIQDAARDVFAKVSKAVGPRLVESAVEAQITTSVCGVIEVVKVKPGVALTLIFKHLNEQKQHTNQDVELLYAVLDVEEAAEELEKVKYQEDIVNLALSFCVQNLENAADVMQRYIEMRMANSSHMAITVIQKALNVPETRAGALMAAEAFGLGAELDDVESISAILRAAISVLGDDREDTRSLALSMVPKLLNSLEELVISELSEEEQRDVTISKRATGRYLLQYLDIFRTTVSITATAYISSSTPEFTVLGEGEPRLFDTLMAFYNRGLDYGTPQQKVVAVECIQDLLQYAPRSISASAANTVAGRCSKVLFTRNDGSVVLALVRLCLQLMNYPASGKEKMVEGTMALAMFNAALCDSGEARVLALRIVIQLLSRSEKYADLILGTVITKKGAVDSPLLKTVMCRFISVVLRYGKFTKASMHIPKLMDLVRPIWEAAETPAQAAAAGAAIGALCMSSSISDEVVSDIKERTLACTSTRGVQTIAGFAVVYGLINAAPERTDSAFLETAADHLRSATAFCVSDKTSVLWLLRAALAVASTGCVDAALFKPEVYVPIVRRINAGDEQSLSTAMYFKDTISAAYPASAGAMQELPGEQSAQWVTVGSFDADLDDEVVADTVL